MKKRKEYIGDRRYFVQEDKNIIVEKVEPLAVMDEVYKSGDRLLRKLGDAFIWNGFTYMSANDGADIIARAVCDDRDTFNERFGKELCDTKVELKYHMRMFKNYERFINDVRNVIDKLNELKYKHADKALELQDKLNEMYKGENA